MHETLVYLHNHFYHGYMHGILMFYWVGLMTRQGDYQSGPWVKIKDSSMA